MDQLHKDSNKDNYTKQPQIINDDEIDLVALAKTIWNGRRTIVKTTILVVILGLLYAFLSTEQYTTTVKLMPETSQQSSLGSLGSLASQFGFGGLPSGGDLSEGIPPDYFPEIMKSLPFMNSLLRYETFMKGPADTMSIYHYFAEYRSKLFVKQLGKYTIKLPFTILNLLKGEDDGKKQHGEQEIIQFTKKEWGVIEKLQDLISVEIGKETGIVSVTVTMPEDYLAADVADQVTGQLVDYIKEYRTEKAKEDLSFIQERLNEALQRFEKAQEALATFRDQSHGQLTEMARTHEQRLQSEYDLAYNVYSSMAQRLEEAKIKLQEETPVVKVLEPAYVPKDKSAPKRKLILVVSVFLGMFMGIGVVFGVLIIRKIKESFISE